MSKINLWEETLEVLKKYNKTFDDVEYIITNSYIMPKDMYSKISNVTYNNGYGLPVVNTSLKLCGKDWWLERGEYDGSEWFDFKTMPQKLNLTIIQDIDFAEDVLWRGDE